MRVRLTVTFVIAVSLLSLAAALAGPGPQVPTTSSSDRALLAAIEARIDPGRRVPLAPLSDIHGRMVAGEMAGLDEGLGKPSSPGWPDEVSARANYSRAWLNAGGPESLEPMPSAVITEGARERLAALMASCMAATALAEEIEEPAIKARALSMIAKRLGEISVDIRPTLDLSTNPQPRRDPEGKYQELTKQAASASLQGFADALDEADAAYGYAFAKAVRKTLAPLAADMVKAVCAVWTEAERDLKPREMRVLGEAAHKASVSDLSEAVEAALDALEAQVAADSATQIGAAVAASMTAMASETDGGASTREAVAVADEAFKAAFEAGMDSLGVNIDDLVTKTAADLALAVLAAVDGGFADLSTELRADAADATEAEIATNVLALVRETLNATGDIADGIEIALPAAMDSFLLKEATMAGIARRGETTTAIAQDAACLAAYAMTTYLPTDLGFHVSTPAKLEADWTALAQAVPPMVDAAESALGLTTPCKREAALTQSAAPVADGMIGRPATGANDLMRNLAFAAPTRAMAVVQAYSPDLAPVMANYVKGIGMSSSALPSGASLDRFVRGMPTSAPAHLARAREAFAAGNWRSTEWGSVLRGDLLALSIRSAEVCLALDPSCNAAASLIARAKQLLDHEVPTYASRGMMSDY